MLIFIIIVSIILSSIMVGIHLGNDDISGSMGWLLLCIVLLINYMVIIDRKWKSYANRH